MLEFSLVNFITNVYKKVILWVHVEVVAAGVAALLAADIIQMPRVSTSLTTRRRSRNSQKKTSRLCTGKYSYSFIFSSSSEGSILKSLIVSASHRFSYPKREIFVKERK